MDDMTEEQLRALKRAKSAELDALRASGGPGVRELRAEVLRIQSYIDVKQAARVAAYREHAARAQGVSVDVQGEAAAAVSEAERIISG